MEVNIVGAASDEEELAEIEDITKVFVYEQRMKGFTQPLRPHPPVGHHEPVKKPNPAPFYPYGHSSGYIKGLC